jgi:sterol desaturase/sphingolipid hydroxylase (fatty acid hydroxylase superfamily)
VTAQLLSTLATVGGILVAMVLVALIETAIPLYARSQWNRAHLAPNLTLTFITFATNVLFNMVLVAALARLEADQFGLTRPLSPWPRTKVVVEVAALDFSFYVAHVAMHKIPVFWRFHRVHHADPAIDVTTTVRQHPVEGVIRYAFMAAFAIGIGAGTRAFAIYRLSSVLNALLEHANFRLPARVDRALSWVTTWPNVHKLHHSRDPKETDTNYGNLLSLWDRLFFTFTLPRPHMNIVYGLDGFDDPARQTTGALLIDPFRSTHRNGPVRDNAISASTAK